MSGARCTDDGVCVATEYCDGSQCAPKPGLGEPCGAGVACAGGLGCRMEPAPDEGTCQPLPELGEPCALGIDGPFLCADGLACSAQLCGLPPGEGKPCAVGKVLCEQGLGCHYDGAESLCKPRVGDGEACFLDDSCAEGLACRSPYDAGLCAPPLCAAFPF